MTYQYPEIRNFDGLYLQMNSFEVPDGAMEVANNIVIRSDKLISKTKGYFEYWSPSGSETVDDLSALYTYQGKVIGVFSNGLGYFTDSFPYGGTYNSLGVLTELSGESVTADASCMFSESNQNLYFTANEGIYKLESYDSAIRKAGVPPGLSITSTFVFAEDGVLVTNSQTGYRAVFGRRDTNGNLLLGAPSDVANVGVIAAQTGLAYSNTGGVCTVTTNSNAYDGRVGQQVIISAATDPTLNGTESINAVTSGTSFTFVNASANGSGTLTVSVFSTPSFRIDIPSEITSTADQWFVQIYRTSPSTGVADAPDPDFKLVTEQVLTTADISAGFVSFTDTVDSSLLINSLELYTNPNTREGEAQANVRPPQAEVIGVYKGYQYYADVVTVQRLFLDLVDRSTLNEVVFKVDATEEHYVPGTNVYNTPSTVTGSGTGTITITDFNNVPVTGDKFLIYGVTGTLPPGVYTVVATAFPVYSISAPGLTMTAGTVEFVQQANGYFLYDNIIDLSLTVAENLSNVAKSFVRSVNQNSSIMYANYLSQFIDLPGKMGFQSKGVSDPIYVRLGSTPVNPPFIQPVPTSFSTGKQVYSENDDLPNGIFFSKIQEPEAVPVLNFLLIGSAAGRILNAVALRDCIIVVKEDGIYKITGDVLGDFAVSELDTTVRGLGSCTRAAAEINNTVIAMSNQGVLSITESTVSVISRRIEDVIQPLVGRDLSGTFLGGSETDRLFYVQTKNINVGQDDVTWIYNFLNSSWTQSDYVFSHIGLGPNEEVFGVRLNPGTGENVLYRQRKTQTLVDYCAGFAVGTATSVVPLSLVFTITGGNSVTPGVGDVLLYDEVFNRITAVSGSGPYTLTLAQTTNIPEGQTVTLFKAFTSNITMAPFHAGMVGRSKHFAQLQIHLRQQAITDLILSFGGAYFGSSESTDWLRSNISSSGSAGWGFAPWGLFPWGLTDGINLLPGTAAASIIRTWVPRFAARNTYIKPILEHTQAGQPLLIQALSWSVRGYGERTSR